MRRELFSKIFSDYKEFMVDWLSRGDQQVIQKMNKVIANNSVPLYSIDEIEKGKRRTYLAIQSLQESLKFVHSNIVFSNCPAKLNPDTTHYETFSKMRKSIGQTKRYSIQFNKQGFTRPMLFFEVDDNFSACFIHTGKNTVELNGYYESDSVLTKEERIYGLIEVDSGKYTIQGMKNNQMLLSLWGKGSEGELKLNFLDNIYIDDTIRLSSMRQTDLTNY